MLKKIVEYSKKKPHYILLGLFVVSGFTYFLIFSLVGTSHTKNSHAQTSSTVVYVPSFGVCGTGKANAVDTAVDISNWINAAGNIPNGTPGDPTIVKFSAPCYEIESTIFLDGGASIPFKDGDCAHLYQTPSTKLCANTRHDIVFDGSGTQFIFFTNGDGYKAPPGDDFGPDPTYGFSYNDIKWYILGGDDLTFQNINMQGPAAAGSQYFVSDDGAAGMEISGAKNVTVQNNTFSHIFGDFIDLIGYHPLGGNLGEAPATNITIQNNYLYAAGRDGISPVDANTVLIQHNTVEDAQLNTYDLEADSSGWAMDNITINGNTDGFGAAWFIDTGGGNGYKKGPSGSSANILVENETVKQSLFVIAGGSYTCAANPLKGISFINNHAEGVFNNGENDLMNIRCATNVVVEGNYSKDTSYNSPHVIDIGQDSNVTIENNTFPQTDEAGAPDNPKLILIGNNNSPTNFVHCGNNLSHGGTGALYDGVCQTSPPPVCPGGETGTPPNCTKPVQHQTQPSGSKTGGSSTTSKTSSSTPSTTKSSSSTSVANTTTANTGSASTASNPISKPVSTLGPPAGVNLSLISKVEYLVDNKLVATSSASPFTAKLDTDKFTNGCHVEQIIVFYKTGKTSASNQPLCVKHGASSGNSDYLFWLIPAAILLALGGAYTYYRHQLPTWLKPKKDKKKPSSGPKIIVGKM